MSSFNVTDLVRHYVTAKDTEEGIFNHHAGHQFHICLSDQQEEVDAQARVIMVQTLGLTTVLQRCEKSELEI